MKQSSRPSLKILFILLFVFSHSLYALPMSWGRNDNGQLGHNAAGGAVPNAILNSAEFSMIDLGAHTSIALKADGSVWSWGGNWHGELGDGTTTQSSLPVQVVGLNNVIDVSRAAKTDTVAALKADGSVWCWGQNNLGQLGNGSQVNSLIPVQSNISNVIAIATGPADVMALKDDGTVWAWGENLYWKFGSATPLTAGGVFQVSGITDVVAIASGSYHALYLKADGSVWLSGRMGSVSVRTPTQVSGLSGVVEITAGQEYSLARKKDGTVWAWGANYYGNLGDGTTTERLTPVQISGLNSVVDLAADLFHSLAVKSDGTVWSWGSNTAEQLGHFNAQSTPQQIIALSGFNAVATGGNHSAAYLSRSSVSNPLALNAPPIANADAKHIPASSGNAHAEVTLDTLPPSLKVKTDVTLMATDSAGIAFDVLSLATADDVGCGSASLSAIPTPNLYPIGITHVEISATDCVGLRTSANVLVRVLESKDEDESDDEDEEDHDDDGDDEQDD